MILTPDQVTAIAPDAASLKAGQALATPRKWQSLGRDESALWGLAQGSGKTPYQTRVALSDLATKCSCPSRKFPCKHAIGLMLLATLDATALAGNNRPDWLSEWLDSRAAKAAKPPAAKTTAPKDEKAAAKRRAKRDTRMATGVSLLRQSLLDLARDGLASPAARDPTTWENLARRMIDSQAPGLAGSLRHIADSVLREPDVDAELPFALGYLWMLLHAIDSPPQDPALKAEIQTRVGGKNADLPLEAVPDRWFVAGRRIDERDRLITSSSWLHGARTGRWARVLRFAHAPQTIHEPWPLGATIETTLDFTPGPPPQRALPNHEGAPVATATPSATETSFDALLTRFAEALAANPFLHAVPFLMALHPAANHHLIDPTNAMLPWSAPPGQPLLVDAICGGAPTLMCGEWDGRAIRLLAILDGEVWFPLAPQQA